MGRCRNTETFARELAGVQVDESALDRGTADVHADCEVR
jgi:hypothetical protein